MIDIDMTCLPRNKNSNWGQNKVETYCKHCLTVDNKNNFRHLVDSFISFIYLNPQNISQSVELMQIQVSSIIL